MADDSDRLRELEHHVSAFWIACGVTLVALAGLAMLALALWLSMPD